MKKGFIEEYQLTDLTEVLEKEGNIFGEENKRIIDNLEKDIIYKIQRTEKEAQSLVEAAKMNSIDFYKLSSAVLEPFITVHQLASMRYLEFSNTGKVTAHAIRKDLAFSGPPGSGKSAGAEYLAERLGIPVVRIQGGPNIDDSVLYGKTSVKNENGVSVTYFEEGIVTKAVKNGYMLLIEEADMIKPQYLTQLNTILDRRPYIPSGSEELISPHPLFFTVFTMNSKGWGNVQGLSSRYAMDHSLLDRMLLTEVEYLPRDVEIDIVRKNVKAFYESIGLTGEDVPEAQDAFLGLEKVEAISRMVDLAADLRAKSEMGEISKPLTTRGIVQIFNSAAFMSVRLPTDNNHEFSPIVKSFYHNYTAQLPDVGERRLVEDIATTKLSGVKGTQKIQYDDYKIAENVLLEAEEEKTETKRGRKPKA